HSIIEDKKKRLWAFSTNRIFLLDAESKKIVKTFIGPGSLNIHRVCFDTDNRCWLITRANGLYLFDPENNGWKSVYTGSKGFSGCATEWKINNKNYIVYISESNIGLVLIDPQTMAFRLYKDYAFASPKLDDNGIGYVYADKKNILWIGTQNGISYVTVSSQLFDVIPIGVNEHLPDFSKQKIVYDIYSDENGYWISKWYLSGLFHYLKNWQFDKYFPALYPAKSSSPNLTSMSFNTKYYKNKMYMTTDSGLVELDTVSFRTKIIPSGNAEPVVNLRTILPINDTIWWIQSYYFGIYIYDALHKKFIKHYHYSKDCGNCVPDKINEMFKSSRGNIYLCSNNGLFEYRARTDDFINYKKNIKDPVSLPGDSLNGITEDRDGKLWIGTNRGLCVFNEEDKKIEKVFPENEWIGSVNALCVDKWRNIWFTANTGAWCRLSGTDKFINFNTDNDIPENSGDGVLITLDDGKIYDGCLDAVVRFNPEWIHEYSGLSTRSIITEASVANNFIPLYKNGEKNIEITSGVHLFTVDFSLVNYNFISGNRYFYRLLPLSKAWQQNLNGHLSFYDIPPGKYTLEVKGYSEFDRVSSTFDSLRIEVEPFWWQSWWFKLFSVMLVSAIIFLLVRRRIINIRKQAAILQQQTSFKQKIAETEMQALRAQMNPHFIFNSLNSIENFMMKNDKRMASDYFNKFATLIRMILESSRNELIPFSTDVEAMQLYIDLEQLRFNNKFSYHTVLDPELLNGDYRVPSLLVQPYLENAILHGIAHSDKQNLHIILSAFLENDFIKYTIEDNGVGRKLAAQYNRQNKPNHKSVGLEITKERINIFNEPLNGSPNVHIIDLTGDDDIPNGTRVEIKIKAV
ncbi:MAG TPA: histidine kinase, partial [Puia sp.]